MWKRILFSMLVFIILVGCGTQTDVPVTATSIPTETYTPTFTPTNIPTRTFTPIPTVTWTPLPTLSSQEANIKVKELLETNGGCDLPCWWGITPNKTTWAEALHFITPFTIKIGQGEEGYEYSPKDGQMHYATNFSIYYKINEFPELIELRFSIWDYAVSDITIFPPATEYKYQLHQILTLLGLPKQILINAQSSSMIPELPPTVITLDYSDKGVWAFYGYTPTKIGEYLVICPKSNLGQETIFDNIGGRLELFDPEISPEISIEEYANMIGGFTAKKLEDSTNMSMEIFYNSFINPKPETCLETPANLWP